MINWRLMWRYVVVFAAGGFASILPGFKGYVVAIIIGMYIGLWASEPKNDSTNND